MIPMQQALDGIVAWAVNDVISAMPNSMSKFVSLMAVGSMRNNPDSFLGSYKPILARFGIVTDDYTSVNENALKSAFAEALGTMPSVSWMGFTFTASDVDKLYRRLGI